MMKKLFAAVVAATVIGAGALTTSGTAEAGWGYRGGWGYGAGRGYGYGRWGYGGWGNGGWRYRGWGYGIGLGALAAPYYGYGPAYGYAPTYSYGYASLYILRVRPCLLLRAVWWWLRLLVERI